ncbi:hypothetical protein GGI22_004566, partial [Coemansia erecta]
MGGVKVASARAKESDPGSDVEFDLTSSLIPQANQAQPKKTSKPAQKHVASTSELPDGASDADFTDDDGSETEMIRQSVQAHNRKKKKSGGFQSMGLHPPL